MGAVTTPSRPPSPAAAPTPAGRRCREHLDDRRDRRASSASPTGRSATTRTCGLITPERRGTTRVYHRRDRTRLDLILRGKRLGFPLEEIRTIIDMYDEQPGEAGQLALPARPDRRPARRAGAAPPGHRGRPHRARRRSSAAARTTCARCADAARTPRSGDGGTDLGADGVQLGEEGELERAAQERHAAGAAGAALGADGPLDRLAGGGTARAGSCPRGRRAPRTPRTASQCSCGCS